MIEAQFIHQNKQSININLIAWVIDLQSQNLRTLNLVEE